MAVIDFVKWDANSNLLAWKYPSSELSTWTQLVVSETQEAFLVKEGVYQGPFGAGRHTLSTENIPILRELIGLPFGGKSPFTAEVWFINRTTNLDIKWGTPDAIQLQDPKYQLMLPVRAFGQYGIAITHPKKFLLKLVGTVNTFDVDTLADYFRGIFTTRIKTEIANAIIKNNCSILEVSTELEKISSILKASLTPDMEEYGITLIQFNVHSINVPENDSAVQSLKASLAKRTEMNILGFNYQQERSFDIMETAAGNEGTAGSVMGAGLGMGMGVGMGVPMGNAFSELSNQIQQNNKPISGYQDIECAKCGLKNANGTNFCRGCGKSMANLSNRNITCTNCSSIINDDSKFCPNCGKKLINICTECNTELLPDAKFCNNCGKVQ